MTITEKLAYILNHGFILSRTSTFTVTNTFDKKAFDANTDLNLTENIDSLAWKPEIKSEVQRRLYQLQLLTKNSSKNLSYNSQWFFKQSLPNEINRAYSFLKEYYTD